MAPKLSGPDVMYWIGWPVRAACSEMPTAAAAAALALASARYTSPSDALMYTACPAVIVSPAKPLPFRTDMPLTLPGVMADAVITKSAKEVSR
jgi:hypothetical protein